MGGCGLWGTQKAQPSGSTVPACGGSALWFGGLDKVPVLGLAGLGLLSGQGSPGLTLVALDVVAMINFPEIES